MKRRLFILVAALVLLVSAGPVWAADGPTATVNVTALNIRQGPGTNYPIVSALHNGDAVPVTGRDAGGGWYQVTLKDGSTGWISAVFTQLSGDASTLAVVQAPAAPAKPARAVPVAGAGAATTDGRTIVFQANSGGAIYVVNTDGSGLRQLTTGIDPAISPDGQMVAFTRWDSSSPGTPGAVWVINIDGTNERKVLADVAQPKSPAWSPDGQQIVVSMQSGGTTGPTWVCFRKDGPCRLMPADPHWGLRLVNVNTGQWRDLPRDIYSFTPTWDPANTWHIVFHGDNGLVNLDINRDSLYPVNKELPARSPVFSPDGSRLAVTYKQNDHWEIHVMNADGTGDVRLTDTSPTAIAEQILAGQTPRSPNNAAAAWSPDGSQLAFLTDRTGQWEIWVMNADGSGQRPLIPASVLNGINIQYNGVDERVMSWS